MQLADFASKKTAMFCTHGGGAGHTLADFKKQAMNAQVLDGLELYNPRQVKEGDNTLKSWLAKMQ